MKKNIALSILLTATLGANAQQKTLFANETKFQAGFHKHVANMLNMQTIQPQQKTTVLQERLRAESVYDHTTSTPSMTDSIVLKYTGNNSSKFNYNYMNYRFDYSLQVNPAYYPYQMEQVDIMADSIWYYYTNNGTSQITLSSVITQNFNSTNGITKYFSLLLNNSVPSGADLIINTYNTQGKHEELLILEGNGSNASDSVGRIKYFYDAQGRNSIDTAYDYDLGDWSAVAVFEYVYDANSNITSIKFKSQNNSGAWITLLEYDHTFYPNNKLQTVIGLQDNTGSGNLMPVVKDTFEYANNTPFFTSLLEYQNIGGVWTPLAKLSKTLNTQNLPDTFYVYGNYNTATSQFQVLNKTKFTYTTYNNPLQATQFNNDGSGNFSLTGIINYYYDLFNNTNSVNTIAPKANITLYPNPATNTINLEWKEGSLKGATMQVTNALGQLMISTHHAAANKNIALPIGMLSVGNYFVTLRDEQGNVVYTGQFVKK